MIHVGDITKLNGAELPLVDIITGGSPCQDYPEEIVIPSRCTKSLQSQFFSRNPRDNKITLTHTISASSHRHLTNLLLHWG